MIPLQSYYELKSNLLEGGYIKGDTRSLDPEPKALNPMIGGYSGGY